MLDNSPKAWIRVGTSVYQQYLGSQTWVQVRNRITTFEHSSDDITVNGAVYSFLKAEDGTALSNADEQHEEIMKTLRLWNADYRQFNAASLLSDKSRTTDNANIWYTTVKGVDANYLKSHDGVLRIYNDPGSYYNYKTIAIRKGAFAGCDDLKEIEFWQTNGRSENSYSEPKMVAEALAKEAGCQALITGEDLGQVASQTAEALVVTDSVVTMPVFRPLIGMDKIEIMDRAQEIGTYEKSIEPYEDCCTVFLPKHPTTKPRLERILESESRLDVEGLVANAVASQEIITIDPEDM